MEVPGAAAAATEKHNPRNSWNSSGYYSNGSPLLGSGASKLSSKDSTLLRDTKVDDESEQGACGGSPISGPPPSFIPSDDMAAGSSSMPPDEGYKSFWERLSFGVREHYTVTKEGSPSNEPGFIGKLLGKVYGFFKGKEPSRSSSLPAISSHGRYTPLQTDKDIPTLKSWSFTKGVEVKEKEHVQKPLVKSSSDELLKRSTSYRTSYRKAQSRPVPFPGEPVPLFDEGVSSCSSAYISLSSESVESESVSSCSGSYILPENMMINEKSQSVPSLHKKDQISCGPTPSSSVGSVSIREYARGNLQYDN